VGGKMQLDLQRNKNLTAEKTAANWIAFCHAEDHTQFRNKKTAGHLLYIPGGSE